LPGRDIDLLGVPAHQHLADRGGHVEVCADIPPRGRVCLAHEGVPDARHAQGPTGGCVIDAHIDLPKLAEAGSKSSTIAGTGGAWEVTVTNWPVRVDWLMAPMTSSTCRASSPPARCGRPVRIARAISSTPRPRPWAAPSDSITCHCSAP